MKFTHMINLIAFSFFLSLSLKAFEPSKSQLNGIDTEQPPKIEQLFISGHTDESIYSSADLVRQMFTESMVINKRFDTANELTIHKKRYILFAFEAARRGSVMASYHLGLIHKEIANQKFAVFAKTKKQKTYQKALEQEKNAAHWFILASIISWATKSTSFTPADQAFASLETKNFSANLNDVARQVSTIAAPSNLENRCGSLKIWQRALFSDSYATGIRSEIFFLRLLPCYQELIRSLVPFNQEKEIFVESLGEDYYEQTMYHLVAKTVAIYDYSDLTFFSHVETLNINLTANILNSDVVPSREALSFIQVAGSFFERFPDGREIMLAQLFIKNLYAPDLDPESRYTKAAELFLKGAEKGRKVCYNYLVDLYTSRYMSENCDKVKRLALVVEYGKKASSWNAALKTVLSVATSKGCLPAVYYLESIVLFNQWAPKTPKQHLPILHFAAFLLHHTLSRVDESLDRQQEKLAIKHLLLAAKAGNTEAKTILDESFPSVNYRSSEKATTSIGPRELAAQETREITIPPMANNETKHDHKPAEDNAKDESASPTQTLLSDTDKKEQEQNAPEDFDKELFEQIQQIINQEKELSKLKGRYKKVQRNAALEVADPFLVEFVSKKVKKAWDQFKDDPKVKRLLEDIERNPFEPHGEGQPEWLKYEYRGCQSRRIDSYNRIVYQPRADGHGIIIMMCGDHY